MKIYNVYLEGEFMWRDEISKTEWDAIDKAKRYLRYGRIDAINKILVACKVPFTPNPELLQVTAITENH